MSYDIPNQLVLPRRQIRSAWYNALHQMDLGNDVNILLIGDSLCNEVSDWPIRFLDRLALKFKHKRPTFRYSLYSSVSNTWAAPVTRVSGSSQNVTIHIAAASGYGLRNFMGELFRVSTYPDVDCDMVIIALGHNGSFEATSVLTGQAEFFAQAASVVHRHPYAGVILVGPNPRTDANAARAKNAALGQQRICQMAGWEYANIWNLFNEYGGPAYLESDGIHPLSLYHDLIADYMIGQVPRGSLECLGPLGMTNPCYVERRVMNPDPTFAAYASGTPTGYTALGGTTFGKDATNFISVNDYSLRVIGNASGQAGIRYSCPIEEVRGKWVTASALVRVPSGNPSTSGRIGVGSTTSPSLGGVAQANGTDNDEQFFWIAHSGYCPVANATFFANLYADSASGTSFQIQVDRFNVVLGTVPYLG